MPTLDVLRPTADTSTVVGYTVVGGTEAWEVLDDTPPDDNTYIDPPGTPPPPVPQASLGFGSTSLPGANFKRHQLRFNLRGYSTAGPGQQAEATLFFGFHQWSQRFTFNSLTPTDLFGTWRLCPPELVDLSPALVAGNIQAPASGVGASPMQVDITEAYVDVDYRAQPTYTVVTLEGGVPETVFVNSNVIQVGFTNVDLDGLPSIRWEAQVLDSVGDVVWSYDLPAILGTLQLSVPPLPNGTYTARIRVTTRVAGNTPFEGEWDEQAFEIDVAPPDPPDVDVTVNDDGTVTLCWTPPVENTQVFTEVGCEWWDWEAAGSPSTVDVHIVGGGGGSDGVQGADKPGGGGAGQYVFLSNYAVAGDVEVCVGAGGTPGGPGNITNGEDSSFDGQVAKGGGHGGPRGGLVPGNGGSGGGGGAGSGATCEPGGTGEVSGGNDGGDGLCQNGANRASGGGGGAGGPGEDGAIQQGGDGGIGIDLSHVVGTLIGDGGWFCGGGGGVSNVEANGGLGGKGGGGNGAASGGAGMPNTGGGAGAQWRSGTGEPSGFAGGSGIVIVTQGGGLPNLGDVQVEIIRTDCTGTRRVAVVPVTDFCWTDCHAPFIVPEDCHGDALPCETTYEVRYWACVQGFVLVSDATVVVEPIPNPQPGFDWLSTTIDGECVKVALCGTGGWSRGRPFSVHTPVEGGLPTVITGHPGGRDYTLNLATTTVSDLHLLERVLAQPLVWYQPAYDHGTWLAPNTQSWQPRVNRTHSGTVSFVATGPTPVLPPVLSCEAEPDTSP